MRRVLAAVFAGWAALVPASAFDFGASVDSSTGGAWVPDRRQDSELVQTITARGWAQWRLGSDDSFLVKGSLGDTLRLAPEDGWSGSNTVSFDLDTLVWTSPGLQVGRMEVRDAEGTVVSESLDGVKVFGTSPVAGFPVAWRAALGTSAARFRSGTTIVVSQDDAADRAVTSDISRPETWWAPPRLIGYGGGLVTAGGLTYRLEAVGQWDLRPGTPQAGGAVSSDAGAVHPGVSMAYLGGGAGGPLAGPVSWFAGAWLGAGSTLTDVSGTWKPAAVTNGLARAEVTVLLPNWSYSFGGLGLQAGTGDPEAAQVYHNGAEGSGASGYNGWFGVSTAAQGQIFSPGYANVAVARGFWSWRPWASDRGLLESVQVVTTGFSFWRMSTHPAGSASLKAGASGLLLGHEVDLRWAWRPASDWGADLTIAGWLPDGSVVDEPAQVLARAGLSLSF